MIYIVMSLLILLWFVGFAAHVKGSFIHPLLVITLIVFVYNLVTERKRSTRMQKFSGFDQSATKNN